MTILLPAAILVSSRTWIDYVSCNFILGRQISVFDAYSSTRTTFPQFIIWCILTIPFCLSFYLSLIWTTSLELNSLCYSHLLTLWWMLLGPPSLPVLKKIIFYLNLNALYPAPKFNVLSICLEKKISSLGIRSICSSSLSCSWTQVTLIMTTRTLSLLSAPSPSTTPVLEAYILPFLLQCITISSSAFLKTYLVVPLLQLWIGFGLLNFSPPFFQA